MSSNNELGKFIEDIAEEKQISTENVYRALEEGILKAYEKQNHGEIENVSVDINKATGKIQILKKFKVVQKVEEPEVEIALSEVKQKNLNLTIGDDFTEIIPIPNENFSRLAIFQAIQVVKQSIREAEKTSIYDEFIDKKDTILVGTVESIEETYSLIKIGRAYAFLPKQNMIPNEPINSNVPHNQIKFYVEDIIKNKNFGQIVASRTNPGFLRCLLEAEVPEISRGIIEIKEIARIPGIRAKVAIISHDPTIDAIGACIGPKGSRTQAVSKELFGEKIDIILWNADIKEFIINALTPAKVISIMIDNEQQRADIIVPTPQLSLAIGKNGMAAKLVARLTHWKINIFSLEQAQDNRIKFEWNGNIRNSEYDNFIRDLQRKSERKRRDRY